MSSDQTNPYAPISTPIGTDLPVPMDNNTRAKLDAIIKDANQFWIAILLCIICSGVGSLIIGIWYLVRLLQWNAMAKAHPLLLVENPPPGSIAANFQGSKAKLIVGMVFGALMIFLVFAYIAMVVIGGIAM
jgi:hypothetical protein